MKKIKVFSIGIFTAINIIVAQVGQLSGVVSSESAEGLAGANVLLEGTSYGTAANVMGEYYIGNLPEGTYVVTVTYVGYANESQEVAIVAGEESEADFTLKTSAINLDQVVVTGTGAPAKRKALGQTINSISSEDLNSGSVQTVTDALQGRIPGLVGANMGGQGGASRIRLRGTVSLTQRNQPLIYIDGVRIDNSMTDNASISTSRLNDIDPNNIDRIEVIKGAAAATLFGTEASSGVIQIFTKRGTISAPSYSFRTNQKIAKIDAKNRVDDNYGYDSKTRTIMTNNPAADYMRNAHQKDYSFSVRGGTPGTKYYASASWADHPGSQPKNSVDKWSIRTALDFQNTDKLTTSIDVSLTENRMMAPMPWWGFWAEIMLCDPSNTSELRPYGGQDYTVAGALTWDSEEVTDNRLISGKIDYRWNDQVRSSFQLGLNDVLVKTTRFVPKGGANPASPSKGARDRWHREKDIVTLDFKTNANFRINDKLTSSTVIGAQSFTEKTNQQQVSVNNFPSSALSTLRGGSSVSNVDEFEETVINAGVFVQEQLGLEDRLFLTVGMRMDGNSAFGKDFGFQQYPKAGLSWVVSEEPFWNFNAINQFINLPKIEKSRILESLKLKKNDYLLVTAHRTENVDNKASLKNIFLGLEKVRKTFRKKIIYPIHPRTMSKINKIEIPKGIKLINPLGFFDFSKLEKNSFCLITDSGTIPEEALFFQKPCVTIRTTTERPEIIEAGSNILSGLNPENILQSTQTITSKKPDWQWNKALGDGKTARKVLNILGGNLY